MIPLPSGTKIWLVAGITDMRNGFNGLAAKVQTALKDVNRAGMFSRGDAFIGGLRRNPNIVHIHEFEKLSDTAVRTL